MKMESLKPLIISQLQESAELKLSMKAQVDTIYQIALIIETCLRSGGKVLLMGNGGSAADAQHIAGELMGKFRLHRSPLPALALTTNISVLTAIANDYDYTQVFSRQVEGLAEQGDVVIGFTTSGKSKNILEAFRVAKRKRAISIGFCGQNTELMFENTDCILSVPSDDTPRIQEIHLTIGHILCDLVEKALFREK
jgi:D-sedoheptulose 7-phosphate isomerase